MGSLKQIGYRMFFFLKKLHYSNIFSHPKSSSFYENNIYVIHAVKNSSISYFSASLPNCAEFARSMVSLSSNGVLSLNQKGLPIGIHVDHNIDLNGVISFKIAEKLLFSNIGLCGSKCSLLIRSWPVGHVIILGTFDYIDNTSICNSTDPLLNKQSSNKICQIFIDSFMLSSNYNMTEKNTNINTDRFKEAETDVLLNCARRIVANINRKQWDEVNLIAADVMNISHKSIDAELLWIDRLGLYVGVCKPENKLLRVPFMRAVRDECDAYSQFTMLSQVAWERIL